MARQRLRQQRASPDGAPHDRPGLRRSRHADRRHRGSTIRKDSTTVTRCPRRPTRSAATSPVCRGTWASAVRNYGWTGSNISPGLRLDLNLGPQTRCTSRDATRRSMATSTARLSSGSPQTAARRIRFQYHEISTARAPVRHVCSDYRSTLAVSIESSPASKRGLSIADSLIGVGAASTAGHLQSSYQPARSRYGRRDVNRLGSTPSIRPDSVNGWSWCRRCAGAVSRSRTVSPLTGEARSSENVVSPSVGLVVDAPTGCRSTRPMRRGSSRPHPVSISRTARR